MAVAALGDPAWQARKGAAAGPAAADPVRAIPGLTGALADPHAEVRTAAVLSLLAHAHLPTARRALATVVAAPDADVRTCAAKGLPAPG